MKMGEERKGGHFQIKLIWRGCTEERKRYKIILQNCKYLLVQL